MHPWLRQRLALEQVSLSQPMSAASLGEVANFKVCSAELVKVMYEQYTVTAEQEQAKGFFAAEMD